MVNFLHEKPYRNEELCGNIGHRVFQHALAGLMLQIGAVR
jgi:hypothetical protein